MAFPEPPLPSTRACGRGERTLSGARADETSTHPEGGGEWTLSGAADRAIVARAARQHGVVSLAQIREAGLSRDALRHRVGRGYMRRMHTGVYQLGPLTSPFAEPFAAVLACGPTAVLSHHAALWLLGVTKERPRAMEVTVSSGRPRPSGVVVHRSGVVPEERTRREGIPVTTAARALVDVAAHLRRRDLERAVEQAVVIGAATQSELADAAATKRKGAATVRSVLADTTTPSLTRSEAERRLLELIRSAGLPHPIANARLMGYEVDLLWPKHRLVVEVDGFAFHASREAFERDRARDAALQAAGYRVIRVTWRRLVEEPYAVVATLAGALQPR